MLRVFEPNQCLNYVGMEQSTPCINLVLYCVVERSHSERWSRVFVVWSSWNIDKLPQCVSLVHFQRVWDPFLFWKVVIRWIDTRPSMNFAVRSSSNSLPDMKEVIDYLSTFCVLRNFDSFSLHLVLSGIIANVFFLFRRSLLFLFLILISHCFRLFRSIKRCVTENSIKFIQLVSFGI